MITALFVFAGFGAQAHAQTREIYTIRDISVDERAATVIEAQQKAFASARIKGAYRLIDRLTLAEDRVGKIPSGSIDAETANRLAAAVDVEEEVRGGGRYVGKLAIVYNPVMVRSFLEERSIPYVDSAAPKAVIFPVSDRFDSASWSAAWPDQSTGRLAPFVVSRSYSVTPQSDWFSLRPDVESASARRAIKAVLGGRPGAYRVNLVSVTAAGETDLGSTSIVSTTEEAANAAAETLDAIWKDQSIVRSTERTPGRSTVFFTSLVEWNTLRTALARSPLIFDFAVEGLSKEGAVVKFAYAGDQQRLVSNLRERGVTLDPDRAGWVMTSAVSQMPVLSEE
ncbi:MAG: hypothetical protein WA989_10185 [Henriciella sp.]|uniref:hypothetical protein n=1 Tax=Henriciella sp. TaxID=1968823 RepID=UPI003C76CB0B